MGLEQLRRRHAAWLLLVTMRFRACARVWKVATTARPLAVQARADDFAASLAQVVLTTPACCRRGSILTPAGTPENRSFLPCFPRAALLYLPAMNEGSLSVRSWGTALRAADAYTARLRGTARRRETSVRLTAVFLRLLS